MYELSVHRYRELKHFCLQYHEMKEELERLYQNKTEHSKSDITGRIAVSRSDLIYATELIEMTAYDTSTEFGDKILEAVTLDLSLRELTLPCDKIEFERLLHKFYWLLSERKGV